MRLRLYLLIIISTLVMKGGEVYAESSDSEVGRYQLFQGNYTSIDLRRQQTSTHTGIFLIDTKTGKVKRYLNKIDEEGRYIETWVTTDLPMEK
ncbi:MAG: hypothetical protein HZB79_06910 [Deltaproteobacteria bacterium]|nr:hypothetical protein [Deltaproteobacteria bacterium]